ncbi:MAG TPA: hypothetical protein VIP46_22010 [Pyrinomonadaceae bacterium]
MKQIIDWLMEDERKDLLEVVFAAVVNLLFLALAALVLWPLGRAALALGLAKGYVVFWLTVRATAGVLDVLQRAFRVNIYDRPDAYIISGIAVGGLMQAGWSAYAALAVRAFTADASAWAAVALYAVGALSCVASFYVVSAFYQGHVYKLANLVLAALGFSVSAAWPAGARAAFGWYFNFFWE